MNTAILDGDLPMSLRLKRANRRSWSIDRPDNIRYVVEGAVAYREHAAPLPWEGTFALNRAQPAPFTGFADEATALIMEAFVMEQHMTDLNDAPPYPGIGNQKAELQRAVDYLYDTSAVRNEEAVMMSLTKAGLVRAAVSAKQQQLSGFESVPSTTAMKKPGFVKADVVRVLAEDLKLTSQEVAASARR